MPKIFISSTFRDMHFERDALKSKLTPLLSHLLFPYGESVDLIDLRWGVDTSKLEDEESNKKVLKVCLDEIDEAKPYTIVLIGERYGWIPPKALMDETMQSKGVYINDTDISITNLEIEYAAFFNDEPNEKVLFYFRDELDDSEMDEQEKIIYKSESELHKMKLNALKRKIEERYPNQIRHYKVHYDSKTDSMDDLDIFIKQVYDDLAPLLLNDIKEEKELSFVERVKNVSHKYFMNYCKDAYETQYVSQCVEFDEQFTKRYRNLPLFTLISGDSGSGRKTALALKYQKSYLDENKITIPFVVGLSKDTETLKDFIEFLSQLLEELSGQEVDKYMTLSIAEAMDKYSLNPSNKCVDIFIMNADESVIGLIKALETQMKNDSVFAFYVECDNYHDVALPYYNRNNHIVIGQLNNIDKYGIIHSILKKKNKELADNIIDCIALKDGADTPLYITLLIEKLLLFDKDDFKIIFNDDSHSLNDYLVDTIDKSGSSIKELAKELLIILKNKINSPMVDKMIGLLQFQESYFAKSELELIFKYHHWEYDELSLSLFTRLIPNLFTEEIEVYNFFNDEIREAAKELATENYADYLLDWLKNDKTLDEDTYAYTKFRIPFFYYNARDVIGFVDGYLDSIKGYVELGEAKYLNDVGAQVTNSFHHVLQQDVFSKDASFALEVQKEIAKRIELKTFKEAKAAGMYTLSYIECYSDFNNRVRLMTNHLFDVLKLYYDLYHKHPKDDDFRAMFAFANDQLGSIHLARLYYTEEQKAFQSKIAPEVLSPEQQAFVQSLATDNQKLASTLFALNLNSYYDLYPDRNALLYGVKDQISNYLDMVAPLVMQDATLKHYLEDEDGFYNNEMGLIYCVIYTLALLLGMIFHDEFHEEHRTYLEDMIEPMLTRISSYILNMDSLWSDFESLSSFLVKTIHVFFDYQNFLYEQDMEDEFYFGPLNEELQTILLLIADREQHSDDALRTLMYFSLDGLFTLNEKEQYQVIAAIKHAINSSNDPQIFSGILQFLFVVEVDMSSEEKDTLFKDCLFALFKAMTTMNVYSPQEEILSYFVEYLREYIDVREGDDNDEFITEVIERIEPFFTEYSFQDIVDALYAEDE